MTFCSLDFDGLTSRHPLTIDSAAMGGTSDVHPEKVPVTLESAAMKVMEEVYNDPNSFGGKIFKTFKLSFDKIKAAVPFATGNLIKPISWMN